MKKIALVIILALGFVGLASAQHRGGYSGGHNSVQHNGYNGGYRHGGYGWLAPLVIGGGVTYLVTRPYYEPSVVYYEPLPRVILAPQPVPQQTSVCNREERKIFDEKGQSLGTQVLLVCPITTPQAVTR